LPNSWLLISNEKKFSLSGLVSRGARNERHSQLAAKMPDHELWIGFLRDTDGNLVGLMEEKFRFTEDIR